MGKGILTKYKLDWNLPGARKRRGRAAAQKAAPSPTAPASDIIARIENIERSLSRIEKQLSTLEAKSASGKLIKRLEEIHEKLKLHQHDREDGKAYLIEKKEL